MKRLFWLGVGVAAGVALSRKARQTARQASPAGLASNLGEAIQDLGVALGSFGAEVRAGMNEREQELHDMVEQRSGVAASSPRVGAIAGRQGAGQPGARRARRAEG